MTERIDFSFRTIVVAFLLAGASSQPATAGREPAYLTSARCAECHQDAYDAWADSHHGWAWRPAEPGNVLGDFADATFEHGGVRSRFSTHDGQYFVATDDPDGERTTYEITGTVGVTPLQQYLVELDDGRLQALDVVWDTEQGRWYHLYPEQQLGGDPGLHWTGPYRNWNSRCVSCHVTGFTKGYDPETDRYQSTWSEAGVGCEACHGPGEAHVAWARQDAAQPAEPVALTSFDGVDALGLTVTFDADNPERKIEICAGCHSRRESLDADSPPPGKPFDDHYRLALLREGLYHADGQIQDEVYVYGSFLQSKMHARGVSCGDCHTSHSAELVADIDTVCTQCHNPQGREEYPTLLPASYISPLHHRHRSGTESSQCVSCHMPEQTYMGVDPRRDHSFRVPRPDLSVELGVPNACNGCHTDQSAEWAKQRVEEWFPKGRHLRPHYGRALHAGRQELNEASVKGLVELALDDAQPAIVRASAVEMLTPVASPPVAGAALPLLEDPSPLVRSAVLGLFGAAPPAARAKHSGPLLEDPVRSVRIAAAQRILDVPADGLNAADQAIVKNAIGEYQASLAAHADFPEVQLNLSRFAERVGNRQMARQALQAAIALDPKQAEAWLRLAQSEVEAHRFESARQTLERAIAEVPGHGALYQLLGRVLARLKDEPAAVLAFEKAVDALPEELEVRVEYVSLLTNLGKYSAALEALAQASEATHSDPQVLYLLAYNHAELNDMEQARHFARELSKHHPEHDLIQHLQTFLDQK